MPSPCNQCLCVPTGAAAGNSTIAVSDTATVLLTPKLAGRLIVRAQLTVNSSSSSFSSQSLLTVAPGPVQLDQTVVMGPGATGAVAGNAAVMVVLMQDRWGNTVVGDSLSSCRGVVRILHRGILYICQGIGRGSCKAWSVQLKLVMKGQDRV